MIGDPREAVLSLFRRGYAKNMLTKLQIQHSSPREYYQLIKNSSSNIESLTDFLSRGEDIFGFKNHWKNWNEDSLTFPVMFVRFDALHKCIDQVLEFLNLPPEVQESFPSWRPRISKLKNLSDNEREQLDAIYRDLVAKISACPDLFIRNVNFE